MFKVMMFLSSLLPMYVCLLIKYFDFENKPLSFVVSAVLVLIGIGAVIYIFSKTRGADKGKQLEVKKLSPVREISANYLMAYMLPFIVFDFDQKSDILIFFIIYALLMLLYVKYNLVYFNLVLELFGYIVCSAQVEGEENECIIVLNRLKNAENERLYLKNIGNGLYFHILQKNSRNTD